jgi:hypothetical protein
MTQLYPYLPLTVYEFNKNVAELIMRLVMEQDVVLGGCQQKETQPQKQRVN